MARYVALVEALMGLLTRRDQRDEAERLLAEVRSWEADGAGLRQRYVLVWGGKHGRWRVRLERAQSALGYAIGMR